jgi:hypothetical protein
MVQIVGLTAELVVEGESERGGTGRFKGRVIAIAFEPGDGREPPEAASTWMLVADDGKPAPVWVAQSDIAAQRLGR